MRLSLIAVTASLALVACQKQEAPAADNMAADANMAADSNVAAADANAAAAPATINETSWEYVHPDAKKPVLESIDASGNYITQGKDGSHVDHGTVVMKDGKACFTSAMNNKGESCWTDPKIEVGQSGETTSDKGEKLAITRVAYQPLKM